MRNERTHQWAEALRDENWKQGLGALARVGDEDERDTDVRDCDLGFCCLGVGAEVAGIESRVVYTYGWWDGPEDDPEYDADWTTGTITDPGQMSDATLYLKMKQYGRDANTDLAPREFVAWLGLDPDQVVGPDTDLWFDFPEEWRNNVKSLTLDGEVTRRERKGESLREGFSCANANDSGMPFAQIADLIDYFGVILPVKP